MRHGKLNIEQLENYYQRKEEKELPPAFRFLFWLLVKLNIQQFEYYYDQR